MNRAGIQGPENAIDREALARAAIAQLSEVQNFREAEGWEVYLKDAPFRRPLRGNDHRFLDFRVRLELSQLLTNSALAASRILIAAYETQMAVLSDRDEDAFRQSFYGHDTRLLFSLCVPMLEQHLFACLDPAPASTTGRPGEAARIRCLEAVLQSHDVRRNTRSYLLQMLPAILFPFLLAEEGRAEDLKHVAKQVGLALELDLSPHYYWQFYLPSSLFFADLLLASRLDLARPAIGAGVLAFVANVLEGLGTALEPVVAKASEVEVRGTGAALAAHARRLREGTHRWADQAGFAVGFRKAAQAFQIAEDGFLMQLQWMDNIPLFSKRAAWIYERIELNEYTVPLETFVEAKDERSTTHVHDDTRLVVIESGEMDFWSDAGEPHHFVPGDAMLVPRYHLHGSVITSSECVYHQPLLSPEILAASVKATPA